MTVSVCITQPALQALQGRRDPGLLLGLRDAGGPCILGAAFCDLGELAAARDIVAGLLPPPLAVLGAHVAQQADAPAARQALGSSCLVAVRGEAGALDCCLGGTQGTLQATVLPSSSDSTGSSASSVAGPLHERYLLLRCSAYLVLQLREPPAVGGGTMAPGPQALTAAFEELRRKACGPGTVYLMEQAGGQAGTGEAGAHAVMALPGVQPLAATGTSWSRPLSLRPFCSGGSAAAACAAPCASFAPGKGAAVCVGLHVDVLCYAPREMLVQDAVDQLVRPAVEAQLDLMQRELEARGELRPLRALHFLPPGLGHHITLIYPLPIPSIEADEESLLPARTQLHLLLGLPTNRPLLRVASALDFAAPAGSAAEGGSGSSGGGVGGRLLLADVHAGLAPSAVGGSVHLVQGSYDYHHYMQDKFDDSGWGCAYRSLQTLCSWYRKQLYTARPVPGHREIQQTLVSIGDKQQGFIGSKQWIGAIELGFVLDTLLGVSCKVLTVSSGEDMPSKAREIAHHFDTQGTPIMIGGGVLAYTLLGIDFNERTGDCAFLILDPHYTGPEDLKKIQGGQWVAWKKLGDKAAAGGELFVRDAFYNLLCPQRPNTV